MQVLRTEQPRCARCQTKLTSSSLDDYSISFDELDAVVVSNDVSVADPSSVDSTRPATPEQPRSDDSRTTGMHLACVPASVSPPQQQPAPHVAADAAATCSRWGVWPATVDHCPQHLAGIIHTHAGDRAP